MKFERWRTPKGATIAYWLFKAHHTQINDLYWAFVPPSNLANKKVRNVSALETVDSVFPVGVDLRHMTTNIQIWKNDFVDFQNWNRLNTVIAISGYFEIYLKSVFWLALMSDPGVTLGASRSVDGIALVKNDKLLDFDDQVTKMTRGEWARRISAIKRNFGSDFGLTSECSGLDKIRILRNKVAHTFGRTAMDFKEFLFTVDPGPLERISQRRLLKILGDIDRIAEKIDKTLCEKHVGAFEYLLMFDQFSRKIINKDDKVNRFRKEIGKMLGSSYGKDYYKGLGRFFAEA